MSDVSFSANKSFFQIGAPANVLPVIEAYLANEPRDQALILRMRHKHTLMCKSGKK